MHTSPQMVQCAVSAVLVALWAVASCASLRLSLWRETGVWECLDDTPAVTRLREAPRHQMTNAYMPYSVSNV